MKGLERGKRLLGDEALAEAGECVLQAESCALAAACFADKALRALAPLVEAVLQQAGGSAKRFARRLVTELHQRSDRLGVEAKRVVAGLADRVDAQKRRIGDAVGDVVGAAGRTVESGKRAVVQHATRAKNELSAAQLGLRDTIAAEVEAAEAKVEAAHADARKWVGETIDSIGERARRVGDTVARQVRRGLDFFRRGDKDAAPQDAKGPAPQDAKGPAPASREAGPAEANPLQALEQILERSRKLIASERYDEARELLDQLRWPAGAAEDETRDAQLAAYYEAKRRALLQVVSRHQGGD